MSRPKGAADHFEVDPTLTISANEVVGYETNMHEFYSLNNSVIFLGRQRLEVIAWFVPAFKISQTVEVGIENQHLQEGAFDKYRV